MGDRQEGLRRRVRRPAPQRGAAAVETALTLPLIMLVLLGIIEMGFLLKDDVALISLTRQGGRAASSALHQYQGQSSAHSPFCGGPTPSCSNGNAPELADVTALAMSRAGTALPKESIDELWIYEANGNGYPGAEGNTSFSSCTSRCVVYKWYEPSKVFAFARGNWQADDIDACSNHVDRVGIYLKADHKTLTDFLWHDVPLSYHSVFMFEPLNPTVCAER